MAELPKKPTRRSTRQGRAIQDVFHSCERPLSPQEVMDLAAEQGEAISLTTVYRSLKVMVEEGRLVPVEIPGLPARYELAGLDHHHHFLCGSCDRLFDIPGCPSSLHSMAPSGFSATDHDLLLKGQCPTCS